MIYNASVVQPEPMVDGGPQMSKHTMGFLSVSHLGKAMSAVLYAGFRAIFKKKFMQIKCSLFAIGYPRENEEQDGSRK